MFNYLLILGFIYFIYKLIIIWRNNKKVYSKISYKVIIKSPDDVMLCNIDMKHTIVNKNITDINNIYSANNLLFDSIIAVGTRNTLYLRNKSLLFSRYTFLILYTTFFTAYIN